MFLYSLHEDDDAKPEIAAQLLHRLLCHYPSTLYLNLHQRHLSYIRDMDKYAKSYCCSRCGNSGNMWTNSIDTNKDVKQRLITRFPGGAYKTPPTAPSFSSLKMTAWLFLNIASTFLTELPLTKKRASKENELETKVRKGSLSPFILARSPLLALDYPRAWSRLGRLKVGVHVKLNEILSGLKRG